MSHILSVLRSHFRGARATRGGEGEGDGGIDSDLNRVVGGFDLNRERLLAWVLPSSVAPQPATLLIPRSGKRCPLKTSAFQTRGFSNRGAGMGREGVSGGEA